MVDLSSQKLLVVAPHLDDELIGCGGLISKVKRMGGKVYVLFLTVGNTKDFSQKGSSTSQERKRELEQVAKWMKFDDYYLAFEGNGHHLKLDVHGQMDLMGIIETQNPLSIEKIKPTIVAFPSMTSYNQDHRMAAAATQAALRPAEVETKHMVDVVMEYEMPADTWRLQTGHDPNLFVRLTKNEFQQKIKGYKLYKSQLRPKPNPRAVETLTALAQLRGAQCGAEYAEAYYCHRMIRD